MCTHLCEIQPLARDCEVWLIVLGIGGREVKVQRDGWKMGDPNALITTTSPRGRVRGWGLREWRFGRRIGGSLWARLPAYNTRVRIS